MKSAPAVVVAMVGALLRQAGEPARIRREMVRAYGPERGASEYQATARHRLYADLQQRAVEQLRHIAAMARCNGTTLAAIAREARGGRS